MRFILYLTLVGAMWNEYGPYFKQNDDLNPKIISYYLENAWDDADLFCDDLDEINDRCHTLLSYGDIEYFDAEKCRKLIPWIESRLKRNIVPRYRELLCILIDFCKRAVKLDTGIYIDL